MILLTVLAILITLGSVVSALEQAPPSKSTGTTTGSISGPLQNGRFSFDGVVTALDVNPDGKRIAYAVQGISGASLWAADLPNGLHAWSVATVLGTIDEVEWSHYGSRLLYVQTVGPQATLRIVDVADGRAALEYSLEGIESAHWDPTADMVTFSGYHDGGWNIYLANVNESSVVQLTRSGGDKFSAWTANGSSIVFARSEQNGSGIWSLPLGGTAVPLSVSPGDNRDPVQSPNGTLAFLSNRTGTWSVWTMNGSTPEELVFLPGVAKVSPAISSDSVLEWSHSGVMLSISTEGRAYAVNFNGTVVGLLDPLKPVEQQIYDSGTVYHTPTILYVDSMAGGSVSTTGWLPKGERLIAYVGGSNGTLILVALSPTTQNTLPGGYGG